MTPFVIFAVAVCVAYLFFVAWTLRMTPRERIFDLAVRLIADAERHHLVGIAILGRANEELKLAAALKEVLPSLSDKDCEVIVKLWKDEAKVS